MPLSPTFVATFRDGTKVRMSTHCSHNKLDVTRGIRLAHAAWQSRHRTNVVPPEIVEARFEQDGRTVASYSATDLRKVSP